MSTICCAFACGYIGIGWHLFIFYPLFPRAVRIAYALCWPLHWLLLTWISRRFWTLDGRIISEPIFTMILAPMIVLFAVWFYVKITAPAPRVDFVQEAR